MHALAAGWALLGAGADVTTAAGWLAARWCLARSPRMYPADAPITARKNTAMNRAMILPLVRPAGSVGTAMAKHSPVLRLRCRRPPRRIAPARHTGDLRCV